MFPCFHDERPASSGLAQTYCQYTAQFTSEALHPLGGVPPQGTHKGCRDRGTDRPAGCHRTIVGASLVGALGGGGGSSPQRMESLLRRESSLDILRQIEVQGFIDGKGWFSPIIVILYMSIVVLLAKNRGELLCSLLVLKTRWPFLIEWVILLISSQLHSPSLIASSRPCPYMQQIIPSCVLAMRALNENAGISKVMNGLIMLVRS